MHLAWAIVHWRCIMFQGPDHNGVEVNSMKVEGHTDKSRSDGGTHHTTYGDGWHVSWNESSGGEVSDVHTTLHSNSQDPINTDPDTINATYEQ
jgi:hypothetical protein